MPFCSDSDFIRTFVKTGLVVGRCICFILLVNWRCILLLLIKFAVDPRLFAGLPPRAGRRVQGREVYRGGASGGHPERIKMSPGHVRNLCGGVAAQNDQVHESPTILAGGLLQRVVGPYVHSQSPRLEFFRLVAFRTPPRKAAGENKGSEARSGHEKCRIEH